MSSAEFGEWRAFIQLYGPVGPRRGDYHAAQLESMMMGMLNGKRPDIEKCLLFRDEPARRQTVQEMEMMIKDAFRRMDHRGT